MKELLVQERFNLLQRISGPTGAVAGLTYFDYIPLRIEMPIVFFLVAFTYLLVQMVDINHCIVKDYRKFIIGFAPSQ